MFDVLLKALAAGGHLAEGADVAALAEKFRLETEANNTGEDLSKSLEALKSTFEKPLNAKIEDMTKSLKNHEDAALQMEGLFSNLEARQTAVAGAMGAVVKGLQVFGELLKTIATQDQITSLEKSVRDMGEAVVAPKAITTAVIDAPLDDKAQVDEDARLEQLYQKSMGVLNSMAVTHGADMAAISQARVALNGGGDPTTVMATVGQEVK